jgi:hypothetical protein
MIKEKKKYVKNKSDRSHIVSSVNIDHGQHLILKEKNLNLSALVRDLLEDYFLVNYPIEYQKIKKGLKNEK